MIFALIPGNSLTYNQAYHKNKKTWTAASDECNGNGLEFDKKMLTDIEGSVNKEFWIGMAIYRVTTPWIELVGMLKDYLIAESCELYLVLKC